MCFLLRRTLFGLLARGDIGVGRDEAAVRDRTAADLDDTAIVGRAFVDHRSALADALHTLRNLCFDIACTKGVVRSVVAPFRDVAIPRLDGRAFGEEFPRQIDHFLQLDVVCRQFVFGVEHRDALVHAVHDPVNDRLLAGQFRFRRFPFCDVDFESTDRLGLPFGTEDRKLHRRQDPRLVTTDNPCFYLQGLSGRQDLPILLFEFFCLGLGQ